MPRTTTTMTVRLSGTLSDFVAENVGETGDYENVSEYIRDLIRRDKERKDLESFERLKAELVREFPCLTGAEYERAVAAIAKATGV